MFKNLFFIIKYPYTAGVVITIWLGSTGLIITDQTLPVVTIVTINIIATLIIGYIGFRTDK